MQNLFSHNYISEFYEKVTNLKRYGAKVLIALGGWNDSAGNKYSRLVNDAAARRRFIINVIQFIEQHNFDGLDLDWEYPRCWQVLFYSIKFKTNSGFRSVLVSNEVQFPSKIFRTHIKISFRPITAHPCCQS